MENISTEDEQYEFSQMLAEDENVGLTGRLLLLTLTQENELENIGHVKRMLGIMSGLNLVFRDSVDAVPELFYDSKIEWAKVLRQCVPEHQIMSPQDEGYGKNFHDLNQILKIWTGYRAPLGTTYSTQKCAYPRCSRVFVPEQGMSVRYVCDDCDLATYYDLGCQQA